MNTSQRYIASGSSTFSPSLKAGVGEVGDEHGVHLLERLLEVLRRIERAHLLRLQVVGVVVAGGQRVGAEHDAALHLGAEALAARLRSYISSRPVGARRAQAVADAVVARQVAATPRPGAIR